MTLLEKYQKTSYRLNYQKKNLIQKILFLFFYNIDIYCLNLYYKNQEII